jgi:hypothetical protein
MQAAYDIEVFIAACGDSLQVAVFDQPENDAREHFGLKNKKAIRAFIFNDGLEKLRYINTLPWEKNPDPGEILVDAYGFYSGPKQGYLAFFLSSKTNRWVIKSFHLHKDAEPRNYLLAESLSGFKVIGNSTEET